MTTLTQTPVLEARGLTKRFGNVTALEDADFELLPGEIVAVIGDNGAGKSSLIKCLCGAYSPDEGEILLDGELVRFKSPLEARDLGIETVYQSLAVSPGLGIAQNMYLGRERRKPGILGSVFRLLDRSSMEDHARKQLSELGLLTIQDIGQAVETLSGGQRQGVAVARAHQGRPESWPSHHPDQPQHAARVRGRRSHPHPQAREARGGRIARDALDV